MNDMGMDFEPDAGYWASIEAAAAEHSDQPSRPVPAPAERLQAGRGIASFSVSAWLERQIPAPDRLLGDLLTTTTRAFLVGRTGLGKSLLGLGIAAAVASGTDFLHWQAGRAGRVLYLDGEMPCELIQERLREAVGRTRRIPPGNLFIVARDIEDEVAAAFPSVGPMEPLNTPEGKQWLLALIDALGGVDLVIFDNVMSLLAGDQKDELTWSGALDLVQALTAGRVGQLWLDHTGHASERQYGSSTKAWKFDAVGIMSALADGELDKGEVGFNLSFDHPGKARRRTPKNWTDFKTRTIKLIENDWLSLPPGGASREVKLTPTERGYFDALTTLLSAPGAQGTTTRAAWYDQCARMAVAVELHPEDDWQTKHKKQDKFRKYVVSLREKGVIGVNGEIVSVLKAGR